MKHILILSRPFWWSAKWTWEQVVSYEIYEALRVKGVRISFVKKMLVPEYGSLLSIFMYDFIFPFFFAWKSLFQKYDVVVFTSPYQSLFLWLYTLLWNKTVVICHDMFYMTNTKKSLFDTYSKFFYTNSFYLADTLITTSQENKNIMDKTFHRNIEMIPLGIEKNLQYHTQRNKSFTLGYIGKYDERKRVDFILDLLRLDTWNTLEFLFAGDMPENYKEKIQTIRPNWEKIHILWYIRWAQKEAFYKNINFLYFPSSKEWFWIPLIECFQTWVLPIVHEDADIPEDLKKNCILIQDPWDILQVLEIYTSQETLRKTMIQRNYELLEAYDYKNYANFLVSL